MPGPLLHVGASVLCAHGGTATPTAPNPRVLVSGQPTVTMVAPYAIAGCPFNVSGSPGLILKRRLDVADFPSKRGYNGLRAALDTVHAKTVMTQTLSERLAGRHIDVNAFHPGAVRSDLGRSAPFPMNLLFALARPFLSETSKTGDLVATAEALTGVTGQLFVDMRPRPLTFEPEYREGLWAATEAMLSDR